MKIKLSALFLLSLGGWSACGAESQAQRQAVASEFSSVKMRQQSPAQTDTKPSADVIAFIEANYGASSGNGKFSNENGVSRICAFQSEKNEKVNYLALCTQNQDSKQQIDLYVLSKDADDVVASETGIESRTPEVSLVELGAHELGFAIADKTINQGFKIGVTSLYARKGEELRKLAQFINLLDNTAIADCAQHDGGCQNIRRHLIGAHGLVTRGTLTVIEQKSKDKVDVEHSYSLLFEAKTDTYKVPSELQQSF
ncbi:hypothetical protein MO327_05855 [Xanthomonas translucens]|uniref:hypothetical protein n=1 Tax=Xanthomonas campestris pv. translucens TaxID=343 RepID=UPI00272D55D6|nr:hypothetical protein [Xanthomonas translucens]WLA13365.1 hypothetical protein MO327_05855 [Xanthomonas translucens]